MYTTVVLSFYYAKTVKQIQYRKENRYVKIHEFKVQYTQNVYTG